MIESFVEMIDQWSCFPGSYVNILSEHLFYIFRYSNSRELGLYIMTLFMGRPRLIKFANSNKDGFKKNIKPLFFDQPKTKKKSNLILAQRYGACRSDSQFDLYITQSGYGCTIDYMLATFGYLADSAI